MERRRGKVERRGEWRGGEMEMWRGEVERERWRGGEGRWRGEAER